MPLRSTLHEIQSKTERGPLHVRLFFLVQRNGHQIAIAELETQGTTASQGNIVVQTGAVAPVDARLEIGSASESVQVTAESSLLETETSSTGTDAPHAVVAIVLDAVESWHAVKLTHYQLPARPTPLKDNGPKAPQLRFLSFSNASRVSATWRIICGRCFGSAVRRSGATSRL